MDIEELNKKASSRILRYLNSNYNQFVPIRSYHAKTILLKWVHGYLQNNRRESYIAFRAESELQMTLSPSTYKQFSQSIDIKYVIHNMIHAARTNVNLKYSESPREEGDLFVGLAHNYCCEKCAREIHGTVLKFTKNVSWFVKSSLFGGPRDSELLYFNKQNPPTIPCCKFCRCVWLRINPERSYVDETGNIKYVKVGQWPDEWVNWINTNRLAYQNLFQKYKNGQLNYLSPTLFQKLFY